MRLEIASHPAPPSSKIIRRVREPPKLLLIRLTQHRVHRRQHRRNTRKLAIKVARIRRILNLRQERRRQLLRIDLLPIDIPEEGVAHDFLGICRAAAQAICGFASEEFLEDGDGVVGHVDGVKGLVGEDGVVDLVFVFAAEGGLLEEHLVD